MPANKWDFPPPLCALTGTETFLIREELNMARSRSNMLKRRFVSISTRNSLDHVFSESLWSEDKVLVVFEGGDLDEDLLWRHHESCDSKIAVILVPGKAKLKILNKLPKSLVAKFESPKPWEREEWVSSWLKKKAGHMDMILSDPLSKLLVKTLGEEDLGLHGWQLWKLRLYLKDRNIITVEDIRETLIPHSSVGVMPLIKAVGYKKKGEVPFLVKKAKESSGVVFPTLALLVKSLRTWITIKSMSGKDPEEIGAKIGLSPYIVKKDLLPLTARWDEKDLLKLFKEVLEVRKAAKWGSLDPWLHLESVLLNYG